MVILLSRSCAIAKQKFIRLYWQRKHPLPQTPRNDVWVSSLLPPVFRPYCVIMCEQQHWSAGKSFDRMSECVSVFWGNLLFPFEIHEICVIVVVAIEVHLFHMFIFCSVCLCVCKPKFRFEKVFPVKQVFRFCGFRMHTSLICTYI